jgi:hypothetical protein
VQVYLEIEPLRLPTLHFFRPVWFGTDDFHPR